MLSVQIGHAGVIAFSTIIGSAFADNALPRAVRRISILSIYAQGTVGIIPDGMYGSACLAIEYGEKFRSLCDVTVAVAIAL